MIAENLPIFELFDYLSAALWVALGVMLATALVKITVIRRIQAMWLPLVLGIVGSGCLSTAALTPPDFDGMWRSVGASCLLIAASYCCIRLIKQDKREREHEQF